MASEALCYVCGIRLARVNQQALPPLPAGFRGSREQFYARYIAKGSPTSLPGPKCPDSGYMCLQHLVQLQQAAQEYEQRPEQELVRPAPIASQLAALESIVSTDASASSRSIVVQKRALFEANVDVIPVVPAMSIGLSAINLEAIWGPASSDTEPCPINPRARSNFPTKASSFNAGRCPRLETRSSSGLSARLQPSTPTREEVPAAHPDPAAGEDVTAAGAAPGSAQASHAATGSESEAKASCSGVAWLASLPDASAAVEGGPVGGSSAPAAAEGVESRLLLRNRCVEDDSSSTSSGGDSSSSKHSSGGSGTATGDMLCLSDPLLYFSRAIIKGTLHHQQRLAR